MAERQFGPYRLVRQIAVGGMAEIHLAKTRGIAGFEKYVALKMIHPNFAQDDQFIQMLIDEAKIAVQLQHVNVAQTFDLGRVADTYYITMEFVDGADLYKILRRGSEQDLDVPLDVCAFVAKEMATGLDYAHRKKDMAGVSLGIVHRDISPQNVLVSHAGEVKLVDFGIAKATMKARQTAVGVIKGKYYYMSPEQAWGDPLDHRSDIFSAGIVLYEMITGQMLYLEEDLHKLLDMVRRAQIAPPSTLRKGVPPQLERIVMHALAKNANDRYQSAGDMAADLERFLHGYSPVFTAAKLAAHLRKVLGDEPVPAPAPAPAPVEAAPRRNPNLSTQPIDRGELVRDHSEFTDENSVIFRVDELQKPRGKPASVPPDFDETAPTSDELPRQARPPTARPVAGGGGGGGGGAAAGRPGTGQPARGAGAAPRAPSPVKVPAVVRPVPAAPAAAPPRRPSPQDYGDSAPTREPTTRPVPSPRVPPAMIDARTMQLGDAELGDIEEMTMVSSPPGFAAPDDPTSRSAPVDAGELGDYEPTFIDRSPGDAPGAARRGRDADGDGDGDADASESSDDGPTATREPGQPIAGARDAPTAPATAEARGRLRPAAPGAPAHPALSARTPTPAVSEIKKPKPSRRTPAMGVPSASVLQAIVGSQASEPMPTRPLRGGGAPSDGVPARLADPASSGGPTNPEAGRGALPPQPPPAPPPAAAPQVPHLPATAAPWPPPGAHVLPQPGAVPVYTTPQPPPGPAATAAAYGQADYGGYAQPGYPQAAPGAYPQAPPPTQQPYNQLPPHLQPYAQPMPGAPGAAPGGAPVQTPYPFLPYPSQPPTFTKQLAALEADEVPAHLRLGPTSANWALRALLVLALVGGGVAAALLLLRSGEDAAPKASILIDSVPAGATVIVDGKQLPTPTPVAFTGTSPGARHQIELRLAGKKPWSDTVVVPAAGGEVLVRPFLQALTVTLHVKSTPAGADVYFNDDDDTPQGRTPIDFPNLDPAALKKVKLKLTGFAPEIRPIDWSAGAEQTVDVTMHK